MKEENFVYVKLEYEEALRSKRDLLASQVSLLKVVQMIRQYRLLRVEELRMKEKMYKKIKELIANIKKIKTNLPMIKIPKIKQGDEKKEFGKKIRETPRNDYDDSLEIQLQEIQNKLRDIEG
jgi:translation elongation factor EF-Tu-like GTPase